VDRSANHVGALESLQPPGSPPALPERVRAENLIQAVDLELSQELTSGQESCSIGFCTLGRSLLYN